MSEIRTPHMAVRPQSQVRVLLREPRHQGVQGASVEGRESDTQVPQLPGGAQRLESHVLYEARQPPTKERNKAWRCPSPTPHPCRLPISANEPTPTHLASRRKLHPSGHHYSDHKSAAPTHDSVCLSGNNSDSPSHAYHNPSCPTSTTPSRDPSCLSDDSPSHASHSKSRGTAHPFSTLSGAHSYILGQRENGEGFTSTAPRSAAVTGFTNQARERKRRTSRRDNKGNEERNAGGKERNGRCESHAVTTATTRKWGRTTTPRGAPNHADHHGNGHRESQPGGPQPPPTPEGSSPHQRGGADTDEGYRSPNESGVTWPDSSPTLTCNPAQDIRGAPTDTRRLTAMQLTVLQWNIHGLVSKATSLLQHINAHNTAIIVLQETLVTDASILRLGRQYQLFHQPSQQGGSRGLITLVRKDIPATLTSDPQDLGEQVDSLCVTLHIGHASTIDVYNVYCRQRSQLNLLPLMETNDARPVLLSGDFNAHHPLLEPWGSGVTNQRGRHIVQVLEDFPALVLPGEPKPTHIAGGRLDLTFMVRGDGQTIHVQQVSELLSDHWAQQTSFLMARQVSNVQPHKKRWLTQKADWKMFTHHLSAWYAKYHVPESVQQFASELTTAIHAAADASIPIQGSRKFNPNKKHLWYYDDRIKFLTRTTRHLTKIYQTTRSEEDRTNLREWADYARQQSGIIREQKWLQYMESLRHTTNMTEIWKKVNQVRGKHTRPPAHPDPAGKAEELMRDYHERSASTTLPEQLREEKDTLDPVRLATVTATTLCHDDTDGEITREELLRARKLSKDTAPGEDGITYSMLNHVCDVVGDPLLRLFNMSYTQGLLPAEWTEANIIPIPKPHEPNKLRPISLTPAICKMMERVLLSRLLYKTGKLDPGVNGFVRNRSTANCLANYTSNAKAKTAVFIDIEQAFDRAQPLVILEELTKLGVKGKLLLWIQHYLGNRRARVVFQGQASSYKTLENGTPQGGVMSPTLFNVLMNALATLPYPAGTQHIGYADDIVLQTGGKNSIVSMQESLDLLSAKCQKIGFTISKAKTKAMAKTRQTPLAKLQLQGQDIDWVATHRYLGVIVSRNGTSKAEIQHLRDKCQSRNRILRAMSWKGMGASGTVILTAYKTLVRSLIDYASPVLITMSDGDTRALETIQNEALRIILGAPKWTNTETLRAEARTPSLAERIKYMAATFTIKTVMRSDHPDYVSTALRHHHDGQRGLGRWVTRAADNLRDFGVPWEDVRAASVTQEAHRSPPWMQVPMQALVHPPRRRKQDTLPYELRQHGLQSIHQAKQPMTAVYYTDGSADPRGGQCGAGYVCYVGDGDESSAAATPTTATVRVTDFSSSTQAELAAIHLALQHAHTSHGLHVLIHTDSMTAIQSLNTQHSDNTHLTQAIHTTAGAIQTMGRTVTVNWIPSHVGIAGNDTADRLAKQGAQDPVVSLEIPRTLRQLKNKARQRAEERRLQQIREHGGSISVRWLDAVQRGCGLTHNGVSRRCEVVRSRIRLGYRYGWEIGITTLEERKRCRLCSVSEGHTLEHYLRDCERVEDLRLQCPVPFPTLTDLAIHFLNILPVTLRLHPKFCDPTM